MTLSAAPSSEPASASEASPLLGSDAATGGTPWEIPHTGGHHHDGQPPVDDGPDLPSTSPGVARMAAISSRLTTAQRTFIFFSIFLVGYAYGLESQVRSAYQPYATASFNLHSYLATINVLRSVVAVAAQPTAAKVADVFGRFEVVVFSTLLYSLGIAVEASASSVEFFCVGSIVYQIGFTCIVLLLEVLVADFSSMRARVFFSYIPAMPFLVNTWISGNVTSAVLSVTTWRWGLGMWAIIFPVASAPLLLSLYYLEYLPGKMYSSKMSNDKGKSSVHQISVQLYHRLDAVGLVLLVLCFALVLMPLTVTGQKIDHWRDPHIVAPLVIGALLIPVFVTWEKLGARTPLVPFHLLTDRGVWAALAVRSLLNFAWYTQGNYLYTVLVVAFDFSIESATRILSFYSFFGVVSGVVIGLVIYRIRRLKYIIVAGTCIFMGAYGLLIKYCGGADGTTRAGLIAGQVIMGLAGGFFAYPTQASIQASASREHVAILTGLYLSFYNVGSALGTCLSGAIWTQTLLDLLKKNLSFQPDADLAEKIYESPFDVVKHYPVGTDVRSAIIDSYRHVQQVLCIGGICICIPMIAFALALRNPELSEDQVQPEAEAEVDEDNDGHTPSGSTYS